MRTRTGRSLLWLILPFLLLTAGVGCFDARDIEHRAIVLAVAIDQPEGAPGYEVTAQIAVPGNIGESGGEGETTFNVTGSGPNIAAALAEIQYKVSLPLFFGHTRLIAVSDGIAAAGLNNALDYFRRSAEVRRTAWLVIGQPKAAALLEMKPELEQIPVLEIVDILETQAHRQHLAGIQLSSFWSRLASPAEEPVVPLLTKTEERVDFSGAAAFRDDKMIGTFSREEVGYLLILHGRSAMSELTIEEPESGNKLTVTLTNVRSSVIPRIAGTDIAFTVKVRAEGRVTEGSGANGVSSPDDIRALETILSQAIAAKLRTVISKEQHELRIDSYPFGEIIRARYPAVWRQIDWQATFPAVPVDIQVTSFIRHIGETRR